MTPRSSTVLRALSKIRRVRRSKSSGSDSNSRSPVSTTSSEGESSDRRWLRSDDLRFLTYGIRSSAPSMTICLNKAPPFGFVTRSLAALDLFNPISELNLVMSRTRYLPPAHLCLDLFRVEPLRCWGLARRGRLRLCSGHGVRVTLAAAVVAARSP